MKKKARKQLQSALESRNAYDLYDALADNGFETPDVYRHGRDVPWMVAHIAKLLL